MAREDRQASNTYLEQTLDCHSRKGTVIGTHIVDAGLDPPASLSSNGGAATMAAVQPEFFPRQIIQSQPQDNKILCTPWANQGTPQMVIVEKSEDESRYGAVTLGHYQWPQENKSNTRWTREKVLPQRMHHRTL